MSTIKKQLLLNAITGPKVTAPAVAPEVLQGFMDPGYGFFNSYCLKGHSRAWHGHLKNIGLQFSIPNTILLPPQVAEMLGLYNDDRATLTLSPLREANVVYFRTQVFDKAHTEKLPVFATGIELNGDQLDYNMTGTAITLVAWEPEDCFVGPNTELVEVDSDDVYGQHFEESADSVVTEAPKLQDSNSTDNNNKNNKNNKLQ